jgi:hypothetical protein
LVSIKKGDHLEDLGTEGRMIFNRMLKKYDDGLVWIYLAQDGIKGWVVSNIVLKLQVSYNQGIPPEDLLASQEGQCSMKLVI